MAKGRTKKVVRVIKDELLSPYEIHVDENNFTVLDPKYPQSPYGYCSTFSSALEKVSRLKLIKDKTSSINEYVNEYKETLNNFQNKITL